MSILNLREYKKEFAKDKKEAEDIKLNNNQCIILNFYQQRNALANNNKKYLQKIVK